MEVRCPDINLFKNLKIFLIKLVTYKIMYFYKGGLSKYSKIDFGCGGIVSNIYQYVKVKWMPKTILVYSDAKVENVNGLN